MTEDNPDSNIAYYFVGILSPLGFEIIQEKTVYIDGTL